jgi:hypothetical protein
VKMGAIVTRDVEQGGRAHHGTHGRAP